MMTTILITIGVIYAIGFLFALYGIRHAMDVTETQDQMMKEDLRQAGQIKDQVDKPEDIGTKPHVIIKFDRDDLDVTDNDQNEQPS